MGTFIGKVLLIILGVPSLLFSQTQSTTTYGNKNAVIDSLLTHYGLAETVNQIPNTLAGQFEQNPIGIDETLNQMIVDAFDDSFHTDSLYQTVSASINQRYEQSFAEGVLQNFQQTSIRSVLETRREFNTLQGYRKQVVGMYEMEQNPPSEIRMMLVESLRDTKNVTGYVTDSYGIIFRSFLQSIDTLSLRQNFTEGQMNAFVDNYKNQIRSEIDNSVIDDYLVTFHDIPKDTLNTYIAFWESEAGQWFNKSYHEGLLTAYQKAADGFIHKVTQQARSSR